jgi:hypothetical protein
MTLGQGAISGGSWGGGDGIGVEEGQQAGRGEVRYIGLDHGSIHVLQSNLGNF